MLARLGLWGLGVRLLPTPGAIQHVHERLMHRVVADLQKRSSECESRLPRGDPLISQPRSGSAALRPHGRRLASSLALSMLCEATRAWGTL